MEGVAGPSKTGVYNETRTTLCIFSDGIKNITSQKETPVIFNSSGISLLKIWPRNTSCNIVFQEEETAAFLSVAHSGPQTTLPKEAVFSPAQCGVQVGGTGFEVRLPRLT